ncbi:MAG: 3'-5' exonuclease [Dehalococcoidia bacterium]|nr:3'-5' exonuclease [Dehalococcoidia bacterium]
MATGDDAQIEEERRLTYVAMTRAKDFLYVLWPLRYYHKSAGLSDYHSYAQLCRFFTGEVIASMKEVHHEEPDRAPDVLQEMPPRVDIGARIRQMWG